MEKRPELDRETLKSVFGGGGYELNEEQKRIRQKWMDNLKAEGYTKEEITSWMRRCGYPADDPDYLYVEANW